MSIYSTVFFVNGTPVGYRVDQEGGGRYRLHPAESQMRGVPQTITAHKENGNWRVEGTNNTDLIEQIISELNIGTRFLSSRTSATP